MALSNTVLVATDLSEAADEAIRQGSAIAAEGGGKLVVCHVVHESLRSAPLFPQGVQADMEAVLSNEQRAAAAVEERVIAITGREAGTFEVQISAGSADAEVLNVAEEIGAILIVTGSRGHSGIRRLLLGSVAERIARYAHCPVLIARKHEPTGRIIAATDLSSIAEIAVRLAGEMAARRGAQLIVLHSLDMVPSAALGATVPFGGLPVIPPPELVAQARAAADEALVGVLDRASVKGERHVTEGDAASAILRMADQNGADMIVVGTHGRTGLARVALGSVAEKVVRGAHCSVLVVRLH
jgi:nucleotide-binding universal stress UspA family protein